MKANENQIARTATVEVRFGMIGLPAPHVPGRFTRECGITFLTMNVIEVKEINPPRGKKALQWVLYTSHSVTSFEDAWTVIGYYERRPLVEEFHKALKTGCRIEDRLSVAGVAMQHERMGSRLWMPRVPAMQLRAIGGGKAGILHQDDRLLPFTGGILVRLKERRAMWVNCKRVYC